MLVTSWLVSTGCSFDASGIATTSVSTLSSGITESDAGDGATDVGTSAEDADTADPTTVGTTPGDGSDTTHSGSPTSTGSDATESNDSASCDEPLVPTLLWAEDAMLTGVELLMSNQLPPVDGRPVQFARSFNPGQGDVRFEFDVQCEGSIYAWGLVWDADGATTMHADSLLFAYDDDPPDAADRPTWPYGCTSDFSGFAWRWEPLAEGSEPRCQPDRVIVSLSEGRHSLTLTNAETGGQPGPVNNYAGLAAVVLSSDPDTDPSALYDPTPR